MKKFIPAAFIVLLIWNLALTITVVSHISDEESDNTKVEENVQVKNYLTDVTSVVSENCSSLVLVTGVFEDRENTASGITYAQVEGVTYIFTPYNTVHGSSSINVTFDSGKQLEGELVGEDFTSGLALVSCNTSFTAHVMTLGDSDAVNDGEYVITLGARNQNHSGGQTGFGVVSSTGMFRTSILSRLYTDMIATDESVNEGNNGGALCNIHGDLLGILVSTPFEGNEELGYAVSVNEMKLIYEQLRYKGSVTRANPGIVYREVSRMKSYEKNEMGIPLSENTGICVSYVWDEGASQHALQAGDIILSADGQDITSSDTFRKIVYSHNPGDTIDLTYLREGETYSVSLMTK